MPREIRKDNPFMTKLLKLIPTEIIAAYLAVVGIVKSTPNEKVILLIVTIFLLIIIPFYLKNSQQVKSIKQSIFTMLSFVVWVYTLGGPFDYLKIHDPVIGSVILILWTLLIPLVYPAEK